jgi:predicted nucleotidyltransferase
MVSQIILFGSQAKKNARKESDIDLIIVSESFRKKRLFSRIDMVGDAVAQTIYHFRVPIDVLLKTPEEIDKEYLEHIGAIVFAA